MKTSTRKILEEMDKNTIEKRVERYDFLESVKKEYSGSMICGIVSMEYLNEAYVCWIEGLFVSTIVMMQMAFEEGLRHVIRGVYPKYNKEEIDFINNSGFSQIIDYAKNKKYISKKESVRLHELRKMRNPLVHIKRESKKVENFSDSLDSNMINKFCEPYKVKVAMISESTLELEAKKSIKLTKIFFEIFDITRWKIV